MIILLIFAFLSGLATILAPCVWPLLPIILSSSSIGGKSRSLGVTLGISLSFALFTLSISYLVKLFHFDPNILRTVAVVVIAFLGITLIVPTLSQLLESLVSFLTSRFNLGQSQPKQDSFLSGLTLGLALGVIWSPCAGPILATIAALSLTQTLSLSVFLLTIFYIAGMGIPLLLFSLVGNWFLTKSRFLSPNLGTIQRIFGFIMILTAVLIYTNYDKVLQAKLLNLFPALNISTTLEQAPQVTSELNLLKGSTPLSNLNFTPNSPNLPNLGKAPDFIGITHWLNSPPLTINDLKGKVVLVDFWTYTCINCIRTLPFVASWYNKYRDQGFVVIGVHTPEFEFEKDTSNVENAIKQYNIHYPVAQDNNYQTWNNFNNEYWPAEYLIDASGNIRHTHFGEGEYDQTEMMIQQLLKEKGANLSASLTNLKDQTPSGLQTPETYLGLKRLQNIATNERPNGGIQTFTKQDHLPNNYFAYLGEWDIEPEFAKPTKGSSLEFNFYSSKVFLVITPESSNQEIKVYLDNKIIDNNSAGVDVKNGQVILDQARLYNVVDLKGKAQNHILRLEFSSDNLKLFAFTFG